MREEERSALINGQMKELLDKAATDLNPVTNMLRAMLYAEMYVRNELTHMRVMEARTEFVQILWGMVMKWRGRR